MSKEMRLLLTVLLVSIAFAACGETKIEPRSTLPQGAMAELAPIPNGAPAEEPAEPIGALGGPCLADLPEQADFQQLREFRNQALRAEREQDWSEAADLSKQAVRHDCSNEHWWLKLAEFQMRAGNPTDAVATLSAFDALDGNAVDRRLRDADSPLHALLNEEAYQGSPLARNIAQDRDSLVARRTAAVKKLATMQRPPANYVASDACPFECCLYREWTALETTALYKQPASSEQIGTVNPGKVNALGGEMHLRPTPVLVRYASSDGQMIAAPGEIIFLLDYSGEAHGRIWAKGEIKDADWSGVQENCSSPSETCWGEVLSPADAGIWRNGVWWIQIKTPDGKVGWTKEAERFSGADGCA